MHNTSLKSAYFGLDSRECKRLEYLFIYLLTRHPKQAILDKNCLFGILCLVQRDDDETSQNPHTENAEKISYCQ
jgi:hypothetical protein